VLFALRTLRVTVTIALWHFESTLAVVLLLAIGLGVLIAGLVSTPTVLRGQWSGARLRRQLAALEKEKAALEQRVAALEAEAARNRPQQAPADEAPQRFAELKSILTGGSSRRSRPRLEPAAATRPRRSRPNWPRTTTHLCHSRLSACCRICGRYCSCMRFAGSSRLRKVSFSSAPSICRPPA